MPRHDGVVGLFLVALIEVALGVVVWVRNPAGR